MRRRSFLLMAGGASFLLPRIGGLNQLLDPPQNQAKYRIAGALCRGNLIRTAGAAVRPSRTALPGSDIPKYTEPLPTFAGARVSAADITVSIEEFQQYVLPSSVYSELPAPFGPGTYVWGYRVATCLPVARGLPSRRSAGRRPRFLMSIICHCNPSCSST